MVNEVRVTQILASPYKDDLQKVAKTASLPVAGVENSVI
jgi:hypothetical protein